MTIISYSNKVYIEVGPTNDDPNRSLQSLYPGEINRHTKGVSTNHGSICQDDCKYCPIDPMNHSTPDTPFAFQLKVQKKIFFFYPEFISKPFKLLFLVINVVLFTQF